MNGLTMDAFRSGKFSKGTSAFTAFMFTFVFYLSPNGKAVADELTKEDVRQAKIEKILENTPEKKLAHRLEKLKQKLSKELPNAVDKRNEGKGWVSKALDTVGIGDMPLTAGEIAELKNLKTGINRAYDEAITEFDQEGARLSARQGMPEGVKELIRERHAEALERVKKRYGTVEQDLEQLTTTQDAEEQKEILDKLSESLGNEKFKRSHTADDPNKLPWRAPSDKVREPKTNKRNLQAALGIDSYADYVQVASSDLTPEMLVSDDVAVAKGVTEADLQETIDIKITDEIRELAESLDNNPVEIYTWVHNNIRFVPSYGSIQGSQYTLETKRGNATDTASLLISLLRAAGIPAKYAYGTVEIPVDKVMNWVGGVTVPEAAQSLLGQGGIPNVALIEGGKITKIRMEHTWVEAFVDFEPSRGIKNRAGDNWIPIDASFKQYEYSEGMDIENQSDDLIQPLVDDIVQSTSLNEQDGVVSRNPGTGIAQRMLELQNQVAQYIDEQNPDATVRDVLGLQEVRVLPARPLAAGLPYDHIVTQDSFSEVPDNLRHRFKYAISTNSLGYSASPLFSINQPTAELAGKKLALSFKPATPDDKELVDNYLPDPNPDTGEVDLSSLPGTLPGYLINLTAEFTIDDQVVASSNAGTMGAELHEELGLYSPSHNWFTAVNHPIAGEYRSIGLNLQGISPAQLKVLQDSVENTRTVLDIKESAELAALSKHKAVGDVTYSTILTYFAINDAQEEMQAKSAGMVVYRLPSFGIFSNSLQPSYLFGLPRNVNFAGMVIDVDAVTLHNVAKNADHEIENRFTQTSGVQWSANEHLVPEQIFSTPEFQAVGISAVKALSIAAAEGQKVWVINNENLEKALSSINLSVDVEGEIKNAVLNGKVVTAHESQIAVNNWVGSGYTIIDPSTGAGAYKIAGGQNGGFLELLDGLLESAINFISMIDESLGEVTYLLKPLKKMVGQVKRLLENTRGLIEILSTCNPAGALLGVLLYGLLMFVLAKAIAAAMALISGACVVAGSWAGVCVFAAVYVIMPYILEVTNMFMKNTKDFIVNGPVLCRAGT